MPEKKKKKPERDKEQRRRPPSHALWSGTLAFGLVSVPVDLFPANRRSGLALRMVTHDGTAVERRFVCPKEGRAVERDEIVRGYEVEPGEFVVLTDEELAGTAPEKSGEIDLKRFVAADAIDPTWFIRAYFLAPSGKSAKAYRLLASALESEQRIGIASFVMRGKEYLVAIIAQDGILRAETLRFPGELRGPADVGLPDLGRAEAKAVKGWRAAIESLAADELDAAEMTDDYGARVTGLAEKKLAAGEDVRPAEKTGEPDRESAEIIDLTAVLRARLQGRDVETGAEPPRGRGRRKRGDGEALESRSKAELYERAQALEIPGRSQMSKGELVRAVRAAE